MIHPDVALAAMAIRRSAVIAERLGELPAALPHNVVALGMGLAIALRELQVALIDQELS